MTLKAAIRRIKKEDSCGGSLFLVVDATPFLNSGTQSSSREWLLRGLSVCVVVRLLLPASRDIDWPPLGPGHRLHCMISVAPSITLSTARVTLFEAYGTGFLKIPPCEGCGCDPFNPRAPQRR